MADLDAAAPDVDGQSRIDGQPVDRAGEHVTRLQVALEDLELDAGFRRDPADELPAIDGLSDSRGRHRHHRLGTRAPGDGQEGAQSLRDAGDRGVTEPALGG